MAFIGVEREQANVDNTRTLPNAMQSVVYRPSGTGPQKINSEKIQVFHFFHFFRQDARFLIELSSLIIESRNRSALLNFKNPAFD